MKPFVSTLLFFLFSITAQAQWQEDFSILLQKYVKSDGVDYKDWHGSEVDKARLAAVVVEIGKSPVPTEDEEALPYYLNTYNALILNRIVSRSSIKGVGGNALTRGLFFKKEDLLVGGEKLSFDTLEHQIIRKRFAEPRVHFALNCASASCPPLLARAFKKASLDADLDALASSYINENPLGLSMSGDEVAISEIFNWFAEDFAGAGGVTAFINSYRKTPIPEGANIVFQDYDWSLNAAGE